ncbi:YqhA family protein [Candidatus Nitrotoga sp. 1052]|uniref:YqhA family protein n=1 Tax=Candidatus Nitrotoga sp. 1052 TaxID=2886964 RepID=UPI001EF6689F|nr:YqhA family protein [Candidatus Nitrotoga sp. 1052]CAH1091579.1 hypothetical protein NTG1052_880005 [Candidatus Nitrotoga sp. 1052]
MLPSQAMQLSSDDDRSLRIISKHKCVEARIQIRSRAAGCGRDDGQGHGRKTSSKILVIASLDDLKVRLAKVILVMLMSPCSRKH